MLFLLFYYFSFFVFIHILLLPFCIFCYVLSFVPGILCCCIYFEMEFAFDFIWSCPSYSVGKERGGERESVVRRQIMMDGFAVSCLCFIPISFSFCSALNILYFLYDLLTFVRAFRLCFTDWRLWDWYI